MMNLKKALLLLLALAMLITTFTACVNKKGNEKETEPIDIEVGTDDDNPNLAPIDGGGEKFNILVREAGKDYLFKYSEIRDTEDYAEPVNSAVVKRNRVIEEKYNVTITTSLTSYKFVDLIEKDYVGELYTYDLVMPSIEEGFFSACKGHLTEWDRIPFVDVSKSYWMSHIFENTSIGGYQFLCPGAMNLSAYNTVQVMFFNKQMHSDLSLESVYDLVKNKQWTQATMYEMAAQATANLDGGDMGEGDRYGVVSGSVCWQSYYYASGKTLVTKDENDLPVLTSLTTDTENTYNMITYIVENMNNNEQAGTSNRIGWPAAVPEHFKQNQCLFFVEGIYGQYKILDMQNDYGIVPVPTWEEGAEHYSFVHATHSSTNAVPFRVKNLNLSGSILEDMMYYSQKLIIPTYYEDIIHTRNVRDAESYEMLDIVFKNVIIDLALVMKQTGLTIDTEIRYFIDENKTDVIANTLGGNVGFYSKIINQLAAAFTAKGAEQYAG